MKECMQTDKPLISVVMATYNPNMEWFAEQLKSINAQTYRPLELIVRDDCSTAIEFDVLKETVAMYITDVPFTVERNDENVGSNKTFERLTQAANGDFISYCDQDDIWLPKKTDELYNLAKRTGAVLVCSDVCVIDGDGKKTSESITNVRKRHRFLSGENLAESLIYKNFVIGCTSLVRADIAKKAIPFANSMVHDHWLALFASTEGKIEFSSKPLMNYRIHENNQTLVLSGVNTKDDYYRVRIKKFRDRVLEIKDRLPVNGCERALDWANARVDYFNKRKASFSELWKLRKTQMSTSSFELLMMRMPNFVFKIGIDAIKRGIL